MIFILYLHKCLLQKSCSEFGLYVRQVLGPYAVNVTTAARLCGVLLCQGRGRCVRKKPEDPTYLHLPSAHFMLLPNGAEGVRATGELPTACVDLWKKNFRCQWFEALEGTAADQESGTVIENRGKITSPTVKTVIEISQSQSRPTVLPVVPEVPVTAVPNKQPVESGSSALKTPVILLSSLVLFSFIMFDVLGAGLECDGTFVNPRLALTLIAHRKK